MKKRNKIMACAVVFTFFSGVMTSFAGEWKIDAKGWWYDKDEGYAVSEWVEDDGKWYYIGGDGYMVSNAWIGDYYVGSDGAMLVNTTTPDGYRVGADGAWVQDAGTQDTGYLEKYAEVLRGLASENVYSKKFQLVYIDEDAIPELLVILRDLDARGTIYLYRYNQHNVMLLCDRYVRYGEGFSYEEKKNLIHFNDWENGSIITDDFYSIKNQEMVMQVSFREYEMMDYYSVNNQEVSKSTYESQFNAMKNGHSFKEVDEETIHELNEENIQKMLSDINSAM